MTDFLLSVFYFLSGFTVGWLSKSVVADYREKREKELDRQIRLTVLDEIRNLEIGKENNNR